MQGLWRRLPLPSCNVRLGTIPSSRSYNAAMGFCIRRVVVVLILVTTVMLAMSTRRLMAQATARDQAVKPQIVLKKLFPPVYPPVALQALVAGIVHIEVSVHPDGSIASVALIDGHPLLVQAALDSARQSQFECRGCGESGFSRTFTYSFQPSEEGDPDPCCCSHPIGWAGKKVATSEVSQSEDHITLRTTRPPGCTCPDACTARWAEEHSRFRSAKCLYLWKCGDRTIYID